MARMYRQTARGQSTWPEMALIPPQPPTPPRLILLLPDDAPQYYRLGPLSRAAARTVLARLRSKDIPIWARPQIIGALIGDHIELYIDNREEHAMVWQALYRLGAQQSTLPERKVWLTGKMVRTWSEREEPVRRRTLTGTTAANRANRLNAEESNGQA